MRQIHRVVLIDVINPHTHREDAEKNLSELKSLVSTYKGIVVVDIIQHRNSPDKNTFIGSGKIQELFEIVAKKHINIIVINAIVNSSILFNITKILWSVNPEIQVWDRVDLILNIFDRHANTTEAKLQIEIAKMRHMGPRIYGLGTDYFSRQGGGIGTKGMGETNIEIMKRHFRDQIKKKKEELEKILNQHIVQLKRRQENNIQAVAIVGYTNAGKTSLFNYLTKKNKIVENKMFATLDSVTGKIYSPSLKKEIIISDTIGFIKDLPSSLIDSFKSTLMESIFADILIHVIDISDSEMTNKIETVNKILKELQIKTKKIIYVFNKIDAFTGDGEKILKEIKLNYSKFNPQFISIKTDYGIDRLKKMIQETIT